MKLLRKLLCMALVLLLVGGTLIACKQDKGDNTDSSSEDVQDVSGSDESYETNDWGERSYEYPVPEDLYYNGAEVTIFSRAEYYQSREFMRDNHSGALDSQIYARNMKIQKQIGVVMKMKFAEQGLVGGGEGLKLFNNTIENSILVGDGSIDIVAHYALYGVASSIRSLFCNLEDEEFTYFNFDRPYWNQRYLNTARLPNGLYYAVGDVNLSVYDRLLVLHYNSTMGDEYGLPDLYDTVLEGDWTYEEMYKILTDVADYQDLNKNGIRDDGDLGGLTACVHSEATDGFLSSWQLPMVIEQDGVYQWNIDGNAKLQTATERLYDLFHNRSSWMSMNTGTALDNYLTSNSLFIVEPLHRNDGVSSSLINMTDEHDVLPLPKYDTNQLEYYSAPQTAYNIMCVPDSRATDKEMISALMELLCYESYNSIRPYYFVEILGNRYMQGSKDVQIFNLILDSTHFDLATVFNFQINDPVETVFRNSCLDVGDPTLGKFATTLSQAWAARSSASIKALADFQLWAG